MTEPLNWNAHCILHRADDGGGLLDALKGLRRGSLADLVRQIMTLPSERRLEYVIEKTGDHRLDYWEIVTLAHRDDFPRA